MEMNIYEYKLNCNKNIFINFQRVEPLNGAYELNFIMHVWVRISNAFDA